MVELLVVLSILAMVAGVLIATVSGGTQVWKRIHCLGGQNENLLVAFEDIRKHLQNYRSFSPIAFEGKFDELNFPTLVTSTSKEGLERLEPGIIKYYVNESKGYLCKSEFSYRDAGAYRYKESCSIVAEDIERLRFQYYAFNPDEKSFSWVNSWESDAPPLLVKMELKCYDQCNEKSVSNSFVVFLPQASPRT